MELATQTKEKVYSNHDNEIYHLPDHRAMMICPVGHVQTDSFIEANRKLLEYGKRYQLRFLILNETQLLCIPTTARRWLMANYLGSSEVRLEIHRLEKVVVVRSTNRLVASLMKVLHGIAGPLLGTSFAYCTSEEEALALLEKELLK